MNYASQVNFPSPAELPDYPYRKVEPEAFRNLMLGRGAVMLRGAADPQLLESIDRKLDELFDQLDNLSDEQLASDDPRIREYIKRSFVPDPTFKSVAHMSYFDIIRSSGLWDFTARAFPEANITESVAASSRRVTAGELQSFYDRPLELHVDAQFFYTDKFSINFWTPLSACGTDAPGLTVMLKGVQETKDYLEFNEAGYEPRSGDIAHMRKFRCGKMRMEALQEHELLSYKWSPTFEKGDILAFTNFTMHATHYLPSMTQPRTSIEVRVDLPTFPF